MLGYTPEEKLRFDQLVKLRRMWLKDQELSPREPVIPYEPPGRIEKFWTSFLEPKSLWRLYTFKACRSAYVLVANLLIPAWICHYIVKYHIAARPHGIVMQKHKLLPGDVIRETGEVVPELPEIHLEHH